MKVKLRKLLGYLRVQDYRHYINISITCVFVTLGLWLFPNALLRLLETLRDICTSVAYTFCEWFLPENNITATVNFLPSWQIAPSRFEPLELFPTAREEFRLQWRAYWKTWISLKTFLKYIILVLTIIESVYITIVCTVVLYIPVRILAKRYVAKQNNKHDFI